MSRGGPVSAAVLCVTLVACSPGADRAPESQTDPTPSTSSAPAADPTPTPAGSPEPAPELRAELSVALDSGPRRATSPRQLARQIVAAERAIAEPTTPRDVLAAAGHLQQLAYRELADRPRWDAAVRRALPADLRRDAADNVRSRREFRSMHPRSRAGLATELPAWRIVPPAPLKELLAAYRAAEERFDVHWATLAAINLVETGMGRIRGTSSAGAQGPMQFIPGTWAMYGRGDINSPRDAILAAGRFLRAHGYNERRGRDRALFRYNNSDAYVRGVSILADVMKRRPRAFHGYYHWQVYYLTRRGSILLPEGYSAKRPIPVKSWLARND